MWKIVYTDSYTNKEKEYLRDPLEYNLEKNIDEVQFKAKNTFNDLFMIKKGNKITYEITIYKMKKYEIIVFQEIDGKLIKFYPDYKNKPYYYELCYFWFFYDDFNRRVIDFAKLFLIRNKVQLISSTISIGDIVELNKNENLTISITTNFNGLLNLYFKQEDDVVEKIIGNMWVGVECKQGVNTYILDHERDFNDIDIGKVTKIKAEYTSDYLLYSNSNEFYVV